MGTLKGKDLLPHQSLALSTLLHKGAFPAVELTWQQAVAYLRKEAFPLPADTPRGFTLLTYGRQPIGFAKNIGQCIRKSGASRARTCRPPLPK